MTELAARFVFHDGAFRSGWSVGFIGDTITHIGPASDDAIALGDVALVPGLVNAHSHAFQRAIRGRTEWIDPAKPDEDFWTWRERMYAAATTYSPDDMFAVSRWCFLEMALSGITTVGEFHYIHHQPDGTPYDDPNELALRVIEAARAVGIRIALLRVGYQRGGFGRPTTPEQRRFVDPDVDRYCSSVESLRNRATDPRVTVGIAPHSIRAVDQHWLQQMAATADEWKVPLHIHACEQRREIEESIAEYGAPPVEVFDRLGLLHQNVTLVHATHLTDGELDLLARARPTICACPTTERNLGDGFLPAADLVQRDVPIALGSDSHTNIDLWEEVRLVEYHERLRTERRNVLAAAHPAGAGTTAAVLWPMLAQNGARALRLPVGALDVGKKADFVALDLDHPTLVGADAASLSTDICLTMTPDAVRHVWVGGDQIVRDRLHSEFETAAAAFRSLAR